MGIFGVEDSNTIAETRRDTERHRQYKEHKGRGDENSRVTDNLGEGPKHNQQNVEGETGPRKTETWEALCPPTGALLTSWKSACPAVGAGCRGGWGAGGRSKHTASNPAHAMARRLAKLRVAVRRPPRLAGGGAYAHWPKRGPAPSGLGFPAWKRLPKGVG